MYWLQFAEKVVSCLESKKRKKKFNLIIFIESAIGMLSLPDICRRANEISEMGAPFVLEGIVFGSDDYLANIGNAQMRRAVTIALSQLLLSTATNTPWNEFSAVLHCVPSDLFRRSIRFIFAVQLINLFYFFILRIC